MADDTLRALIRLIPPVRALKEDLEKSIHLELYSGTGDLAVRSFNGLQASVASAAANDPYVQTLSLQVPANASDKEKVSLALLAAGQLAAYLEGQTGLVSLGGGGGSSYQTAPTVAINSINGVPAETIDKIVSIGAAAMEGKGTPGAQEEQK
ncbi:MAG TPA: hypothetical protein VFB38_01095 [Chthonomonadaceae bacterium]|nr:hypothetical protein [Chthonomonadaceae bacterium]